MASRIGRPPLPEGAQRLVISLRLDPATIATLDELAARDGETRTDVVERLILDEAERERRRKRPGALGGRVIAALTAEVVDGAPEETPTLRIPIPDPCNRQGSGWEDVPGCLCPFECPDPHDDCMSRVCSDHVCALERRPYPSCAVQTAAVDSTDARTP